MDRSLLDRRLPCYRSQELARQADSSRARQDCRRRVAGGQVPEKACDGCFRRRGLSRKRAKRDTAVDGSGGSAIIVNGESYEWGLGVSTLRGGGCVVDRDWNRMGVVDRALVGLVEGRVCKLVRDGVGRPIKGCNLSILIGRAG